MYKVDLPPDPKEFARIEARRNREEQRKSRIFDSKQVRFSKLLLCPWLAYRRSWLTD